MIIVPPLRGYRMIAIHCSIIMSPLQGFIGCEMPLFYNNIALLGRFFTYHYYYNLRRCHWAKIIKAFGHIFFILDAFTLSFFVHYANNIEKKVSLNFVCFHIRNKIILYIDF